MAPTICLFIPPKPVWLMLFRGMRVGIEMGLAEVLKVELVASPPSPRVAVSRGSRALSSGMVNRVAFPRPSDGRGPPFWCVTLAKALSLSVPWCSHSEQGVFVHVTAECSENSKCSMNTG